MVAAREARGWADPDRVRRVLADTRRARLGGALGAVLIALSGVAVLATFAYAVAGHGGHRPRPRSPEGKRIERAVTLATVLELAAAFVLPVIVSAAGHSDWVLPSIAITIGPLLLYLDHVVHIPRYRPVGWALTVGPVILVATMSGTALTASLASPPAYCCSPPRWPASETSPVCTAGASRRPRRRLLSQDVWERAVSDTGLHVVFGAGQVGRVLSARLAAAGLAVRLLSRNQPAALPAGVEWRSVDASDVEAGHGRRRGRDA